MWRLLKNWNVHKIFTNISRIPQIVWSLSAIKIEKNDFRFVIEPVFGLEKSVSVVKSDCKGMENFVSFFQVRQVDKERIEIIRSQCSLNNKPDLCSKLVQCPKLFFISIAIFIFNKLMIQIIETKVFECIPSLQEHLIIILGKWVHFLYRLIVRLFLFWLLFEYFVQNFYRVAFILELCLLIWVFIMWVELINVFKMHKFVELLFWLLIKFDIAIILLVKVF